MYKIPELLAPAGGFEQLRAAVENGADAVYIGGRILNARMNANNFNDDEMLEAIEYAHLRGVKIYVTLNTLIKDDELKEALSYAATLYEFGVDALILQDLGFAELVKINIPNLPMHLSTQGTVYNAEGVRAAKSMGFSRVVLARELSLEEIKAITDEKIMEVEVFVHGALCICYSGQCQMSNEIGGRSGNRGTCAQPCRLPYSIYKEENGQKILVNEATFPLSPKDLCTIEHIDKLSQAGISSLKIEGRMKSSEYVAIVTGIYRKYLDVYAKTGKYKVEKNDIENLNQIFNRGGFTEGYLFNNPRDNLMSGMIPKHQGIYIGKITGVIPSAKNGKQQRGLVTIKLDKHLSLGDGIEIRNKELPGNIITFMKNNDKKINEAKPGDIVTVGYIDGKISTGEQVYRITDKNLIKKARNSFESKSSVDEKSLKKIDIVFSFHAGLNKLTSLTVEDADGNRVTKEMPEHAEKAITKPLTKEVVTTQLNKTGGTPFILKECIVDIEEDVSVPLSKINEIRRLVLEELEQVRKNLLKRTIELNFLLLEDKKKKALNKLNVKEDQICLYLFKPEEYTKFDTQISRIYLPYDEVLSGCSIDGVEIVPVIPNITKGWHDKNIRDNFDKIVDMSRENGVSIGNIGWIEPFVRSGINVYGDYGLNLYNSMDFYKASQLGLKEAVISHEASIEEILKMDFHQVIPEVVISGKIPLMTSEHCIIGDLNHCKSLNYCKTLNPDKYFLNDRKGEFYPIIKDCKTCKSIIFSYKNNKNQDCMKKLRQIGVNRFRIYSI